VVAAADDFRELDERPLPGANTGAVHPNSQTYDAMLAHQCRGDLVLAAV